MAGFEPTASKSQTSRATSCATPRLVEYSIFSVKSVSGQICGQKFFAETHGDGKARKREKNGDCASFRRSAHEAVTRSQTSRATSCATPRWVKIFGFCGQIRKWSNLWSKVFCRAFCFGVRNFGCSVGAGILGSKLLTLILYLAGWILSSAECSKKRGRGL